MKYSELVKTVVLPPLSPKGRPEDPIVARVEILKDEAGFYPNVDRLTSNWLSQDAI